jgi:hypothetical protein
LSQNFVRLSNPRGFILRTSAMQTSMFFQQFLQALMLDERRARVNLIFKPKSDRLTPNPGQTFNHMTFSQSRLMLALLLGARLSAAAATHYVDAGGVNPVSPFSSWATAATNIQDAVNVAATGETVLVTNGIYQYGAMDDLGSNRVDVTTSGITLQSVNGPSVTVIKGYWVSGTTNGASAIRCVKLSNSSVLAGFMLTNGATQLLTANANGGGLYAGTGCVVSNCVVVGNAASAKGGGCYSPGTLLVNCVIAENWAAADGGGADGFNTLNLCFLDHCIVTNNYGLRGGGVALCAATNCLFIGNGATNSSTGTSGGASYFSILQNCTVVKNYGYNLGAVDGGMLVNSIVINNNLGFYSDCYQATLTNCCTSIGNGNSTLPNNSISNAPAFADPAHGDFHLLPFSPGVNAGNNNYVSSPTDLDGNPRIVNGTVDMGAFENPNTNPIHYVQSSNAGALSPFTNWLTAATNIQDAIDVAGTGDYVVASNGVYKTGGRIVYGAETNRVVLTNALMLFSLNGPSNTFIVGGVQTRCLYVGSNCLVNGFTMTNGQTASSGDLTNEQSGGGAWCESGGVISNCVVARNFTSAFFNGLGGGVYGGTIWNSLVTSNSAYYGAGVAAATVFNSVIFSNTVKASGSAAGAGAYNSTLSNCVVMKNGWDGNGAGANNSTMIDCLISNNYCLYAGGGAYNSQLIRCKVINNGAGSGGGVCIGTLSNCLVVSNTATVGGAVSGAYVYDCTVTGNRVTSSTAIGGIDGSPVPANNSYVFNSVIYSNFTGSAVSNYSSYVSFQNSCTWPLPSSGLGNFTNAPLFVNATNDFHLQSNSPCINAGNNVYIAGTTDLDGNPRIVGGTVDVGAYEYQSPSSVLSYAWAQQFGLPTDGSADAADADGDSMSNFAEWKAGTIPTNAASVLQLAAPSNSLSGITVTWQSVTNITYYLQRSSDLTAPFSAVQSNLVGQAGTTSYTDTTATNNVPYFYRVGVQ